MGIPGEEGKHDIENLCEKIITKIFPNLVKKKDTQVKESAERPKQDGPKEAHTKTHHN